MTHVFIAIPTLSGKLPEQTRETLTRFHSETEAQGWAATEIRWQNDSLVAHARNALVGMFLASDCTDLIFMDSDIAVGTGVFSRLIQHDPEFVSVVYRQKKEPEIYAVNYLNKPELWADETTGLLEVSNVPFGLVRIKRSAIERMVEAHKDDWFMVNSRPNLKTWCLFNTELKDNIFWGEDFYFCRLFRALGGQVWVDPDIDIGHVNSDGVVFEGNFGRWLKGRPQ